MRTRRRFAIVGTGSRARMYVGALTGRHRDAGELVALCDSNPIRVAWHNRGLRERGEREVPGYRDDDFERMLDEQSVDFVIVTSIDRTHARYIVAALDAGCDVLTEKPLTIDADGCRSILAAVERNRRHVRVGFNYRYAKRNSEVKRLLVAGAIGEVRSVHFEWLLDTWHGADYFRRWHRDKANSGGLMVHKASHHFDLVNWWLGDRPETVFGFGGLAFYGADHAAASDRRFGIDLAADPVNRGLYLEAAAADGYRRDQDVFGAGVTIEDDMAVLLRYRSGASLSYHLTAYSPWEGYRVAFNGTRGRLELEAVERTHVDGAPPRATHTSERIVVQRLWERPEAIPFEVEDGGHSGADARFLDDLFGDGRDDVLGRRSNEVDGVFAVLPGIGANASFATGRPVELARLLGREADFVPGPPVVD